MERGMELCTEAGWAVLATAVIDRAYADLFDSYKRMLAIKYPDHGINTRKMFNGSLYISKSKLTDEEYEDATMGRYEKAKHMAGDCVRFFKSEFFVFCIQSEYIDGSAFISKAKKEAVAWFRDRNKTQLAREKAQAEKTKRISLARRKRKENKNRERI